MKIEFQLPISAFSINRMYGRDRRHKTQVYKDWEMGALQALSAASVQQQFTSLRDAYKEGTHCFNVELEFHSPDLLNKQGTISSRVEDLSNTEKILLDILFLPKFHVQPFPYGCKNVNTDDKYVLKLTSSKHLSATQKIVVRIELVDAPTRLACP